MNTDIFKTLAKQMYTISKEYYGTYKQNIRDSEKDDILAKHPHLAPKVDKILDLSDV